tara:strand:+ start:13919 stop:14155 length:237 start_codon:yes stop_codon:yes gene_type:complete
MKKFGIEYSLVGIEPSEIVGSLINSNICEEDKEKYKKILDSFNEIMKQDIKDGKATFGKLEITLDNSTSAPKEYVDLF